MSVVKSPIKWAGGKSWLVEHIRPFYQRHSDRFPRLVEPFCGSCAVTFGIRPKEALLNDRNQHLINFFRWVQYDGLEIGLVKLENDSEVFYSSRERFNGLIECGNSGSREAAELFYYLNKTCFNGLCRFNQSGYFNTPFGHYKKINYRNDFKDVQEEIKGYEFASENFFDLQLDPERDLVYADPPYDGTYSQYTKDGFEYGDQEKLASWLAEHPGPVTISNANSERLKQLYQEKGFTVGTIEGPRNINSKGDRRGTELEMLALKGPEK